MAGRALPTIRDVARAAQVSLATVSAVLNESAPTSERTRHQVRSAVAELGYEPNANARNLKRRRAHAVGVIVPDILNPFFALVAKGIEEETRRRDYVLVLCSSDFEQAREATYMRLLRGQRIDGVIHLSGTGQPPTGLLELAARAPVLVIDERVPGLDRPFVGADNRAGARRAAELVLALGHRRIAVVAGPRALWTAEQRLAGYLEALGAAGIDPASVGVEPGDYRLESGRRAASRLLALPARLRPTAILASNDLMAIGCLQACLAAGVRVPEELGIVGFDDIPFAAMVAPTLTTVRQPARAIGRTAAAMLLDEIEGGGPGPDTTLPTELVRRDSLGECA